MIYIVALIAFLCGLFLMGFLEIKNFDRIWDDAYSIGFRNGEELEKVKQAIAQIKKSNESDKETLIALEKCTRSKNK